MSKHVNNKYLQITEWGRVNTMFMSCVTSFTKLFIHV